MDFEKHQNLHTIIMLKDIIRKWWQSELCFADKNGVVLDWAKGEIVPPPNDFCRLSLFSKEGFRRCNQSVRVLHEKFKSSKKLRGALFHDCHLNFTVVGAPIYIDNEYEGFVFVEGFCRQKPTERDHEMLKTKIKELNNGTTDLDRAIERLPLMPPAEVDKLTDLLEFAATEIANYESEMSKKDQTIQTLSSELRDLYNQDSIIGASPAMREVLGLIEKVTHAESTILIEGEAGTGKELIARAIHFNSPRRERPFVVQNCSAFDEVLLESALFGHERGAFPNATRDKKGLLELADGGTVFLEQVSELSPSLQNKLLRALQEGVVVPVGETNPREINVRVIATSDRPLEEKVREGKFREELFYRLNVIRLLVPPLRDRKEDLPLLIDHFLRKLHREGQKARVLSADALTVLTRYNWPGNIRELQTEIERLLVLGAEGETIPTELVSQRIRDAASGVGTALAAQVRTMGKLNDAVEVLEREMIQHGLVRTGHNKSRLARELGISRSNLLLKIAKYNIGGGVDGDDADEASA
jgi:two-component system response regulator HupR/HoxA